MIDSVETISELLSGQIKPEDKIVSVYLFGSVVNRTAKPSSDVDLAFWVDENTYKSDPVRAISPAHIIAARISQALDKQTDVTILNGASLEIAYEVITIGECIFANDQDLRLAYESKIRGMYFDFMPFINKLRSERAGRQANLSAK